MNGARLGRAVKYPQMSSEFRGGSREPTREEGGKSVVGEDNFEVVTYKNACSLNTTDSAQAIPTVLNHSLLLENVSDYCQLIWICAHDKGLCGCRYLIIMIGCDIQLVMGSHWLSFEFRQRETWNSCSEHFQRNGLRFTVSNVSFGSNDSKPRGRVDGTVVHHATICRRYMPLDPAHHVPDS